MRYYYYQILQPCGYNLSMYYNPVDNVGYNTRERYPEMKSKALLTNIVFSLFMPFEGLTCNIKSQPLKFTFLKNRLFFFKLLKSFLLYILHDCCFKAIMTDHWLQPTVVILTLQGGRWPSISAGPDTSWQECNMYPLPRDEEYKS